jgi:hypothetical protein
MNGNVSKHKQQGVALVLSLLLLFVLLVLGVAGFSNTHIQERSAGNARLQTLAFEAASAGANNAINFFDANHDLGEDELCGATGHEGWEDATDWVSLGSVGSDAQSATLRQRMYCLADAYPCAGKEEDEGLCTSEDRPPRSQLFVLSRGEVTIDGDVVAQRDVEVRLEVGNPGGGPGDGCSAICFPSCELGEVAFPTSNAFKVDGNGEPAITAGCQGAADDITDAIRSNRIGNYNGGIEFASPGSPWDSVGDVEQFRLNLQAAAAAAQSAGTCQTACALTGSPYIDNGNSDYGSVGDPQITYVEGNAEFGGNVSGAGILVVNGNLSWNGTPPFNGLILVLGGTFEVIGGGTGGDHGGSVVLLNALGAVSDVFGAANADFTGGGTALYQFDCTALWAAHALLDESGQGMWSPECNVGPASVYQAGPDELVIASWRENIGWREIAD